MKKSFLIDDDFVNTRLDRWFKKKVCIIPQSLIERYIRKGNIKINNIKRKSSYKLNKNDKIDIYKYNFLPKKNTKNKYIYVSNKKDLSNIKNNFLENNENFAVINKPAGIAVQSGTKSKKNIIDILRNAKEFDGFKPYTVHRIDKETTGILIVAKNRKYAQLFTSLFRIRKIHKTYLCIVLGELKKTRGTLNDELIHYEGDQKVKAKAITHFKVLDSKSNYSLLELTPETGRKHQLRKQLLLHGNPILGDTKYRFIQKNRSKQNRKESLMLHAYKINFTIENTKYSFFADPPELFNKALKEKYLKSSF